MDNIPSPQNYFQTNCRSAILILLKALEEHWDNLFESNFADLGHFLHTGVNWRFTSSS